MNYKEALATALANKEMVSEYDRLNGNNNLAECLKSIQKQGINYQIDLATGRIKDEIQKFDKFFFGFVWEPMQVTPDFSRQKA